MDHGRQSGRRRPRTSASSSRSSCRQPGPDTAKIIEECEALARAIDAFHMEGIRFRIYNVDRLLLQHASTSSG